MPLLFTKGNSTATVVVVDCELTGNAEDDSDDDESLAGDCIYFILNKTVGWEARNKKRRVKNKM